MFTSKLKILSNLLRAQELNDEAKEVDDLSIIDWEKELGQKPLSDTQEEEEFLGLTSGLLDKLNNELQNKSTLRAVNDYLKSLGFKYISEGAFRAVYSLPNNDAFVLKVSKSSLYYDMNENEFKLQQEFSGLFPKVYAHSKDFFWIMVEAVNVITNDEDIDRFFPILTSYLDEKYPLEQQALYIEKKPLIANILAYSYNSIYTAQLLRCEKDDVINILRMDPLFSRLLDLREKIGMTLSEIRKGNVGTSKVTGEFRIIDASVSQML